MTVIETLTKAFSALNEQQKARLRFHVKNGTPIFCGPGASTEFVNPLGHG